MTGYAALSGTQIDADSPLIEDTFTKLRDNPLAMFEGAAGSPRLQTAGINDSAVTAAKIAADAVGKSEIASGAVHQAELNTSTSEASGTSVSMAPVYLLMAGGEYSFGGTAKTGPIGGTFKLVGSSTGYLNRYTFTANSSNQTGYLKQRYINSSPPYDLGDGDVPLFYFAHIRGGSVISTYAADVPPWAYNGPTSVRADIVDKFGKKFKKVRTIDRSRGEVKTELQEITHEIKNADMKIIPHPFFNVQAGDDVVLLDPPSTLDLLKMHEAGESIAGLFEDGYIRLDNSNITRKTPSGVTACGYKWRNNF
jgi:hypothetical protein